MSKEIYNARKAKGMCPSCGCRKPAPNRAQCTVCSGGKQRIRNKRIAEGICVTSGCGKPIVRNTRCDECATRVGKQSMSRKTRLIAQGLCGWCGKKPALGKAAKCEECYFKFTASRYLGGCSQWHLLKEKLVAQDYKCPYTGISLVIGHNMSLDHIVPQARGGMNDIANLQWVHGWVNAMKNDLPHEEFVKMLKEFVNDTRRHLDGHGIRPPGVADRSAPGGVQICTWQFRIERSGAG